ncbi:transcription factor TFIID (or TatA-b)-like protein [Prochlorococcus marinus str. MIT 9312]|uniref:Transcription factor TFIID (Or TatA-b)-like protein n=1 Tax=Prochlorococcus marinus (strain MIT 9312) TaxID=74546 RepID=Q31DF4_PROM9|nr:transcription factor TFIID (or TatA-b)-like protein [Prochlorococcus marinus str. MIT 9312]
MMKTAVKPDLKSTTFCISKSYNRLIEKEISLVNFKFYQKLFVLLISFSTILIFPESPRELGNICESYNSRKICNIW